MQNMTWCKRIESHFKILGMKKQILIIFGQTFEIPAMVQNIIRPYILQQVFPKRPFFVLRPYLHFYLQSRRKIWKSFGSFSFFQASLWLGVDKVLLELTKSLKGELRHAFQCCILIPRKCPNKTPFQQIVPKAVV